MINWNDIETVMLDMDETELGFVEYWAKRTLNWFDLGGYLILESSPGSYHVVFDRIVSWRENLQIVAWCALFSGSEDLKRWLVMQCRKGSSTLRISSKGEKLRPRIVYREGEKTVQIKDFLDFRRMISKIINNNPNQESKEYD